MTHNYLERFLLLKESYESLNRSCKKHCTKLYLNQKKVQNRGAIVVTHLFIVNIYEQNLYHQLCILYSGCFCLYSYVSKDTSINTVKNMTQIPKVIVLSQQFALGPTADMNTDAIIHELVSRSYISKAPTTLVFICCGEGVHEVDIWCKLHLLGYNIDEVIFMDHLITSITVLNIQSGYSNGMHQHGKSPKLLFSFRDTLSYMTSCINESGDKKFVVIGIHAATHFKHETDHADCHDFIERCAEWADHGVVQKHYINFMVNANPSEYIVPCEISRDIGMYIRDWKDLAKDIKTCRTYPRSGTSDLGPTHSLVRTK